MNIRASGIAYVAGVQLVFSALDIFARMSLKGGATFFDAVGHPWFLYWLCLQALIAPFQIRLITQHGLGRGVALMNAFSVLYACAGGYLIAHEALRVQDVIAACLVVFATYLFVVRKPVVVSAPQSDPVVGARGKDEVGVLTHGLVLQGAVAAGVSAMKQEGFANVGGVKSVLASSKRRRGRKRSRKPSGGAVFEATHASADAAR